MSKKEKIILEFSLNTSPKLLYNRISTPGGLSEWFADNVNSRGKIFTFYWDGSEQSAELISKKTNDHVRLRWLDEGEDEYFEIKISKDDITGDVALIVTDFADSDDIDDSTSLWGNQIDDLRRALGL